MTFLELYGDSLDVELGTEDRVERYTLPRRKAALNKAQMDWLRLTDCIIANYQLDLLTDVGEYDLDALVNNVAYFRLSEEQPYVIMANPDGVRTIIDAADFPQLDVERLDREKPGWRMGTGGVPSSWYLREMNNQSFFGVTPRPTIQPLHQWRVIIPYVAMPEPMVADIDTPLRSRAAGAQGRRSLEPFHQALVHKAAYYLEKLRKNTNGMMEQEQFFLRYVQEYRESRRPKGGDRIVQGHNYFRHASRRGDREPDPYRE